jgi:hypothetical protein
MRIQQGVLALTLTMTAALASLANHSLAASVPFVEGFDTGTSGWLDNASSSLSFVASGGQDGGYVATQFNFVGSSAGGQGPVLFRGNATASGGAFTGNWIIDGVGTLSAWVRHDADVPLTYFARFATPAGFPGAIAIDFTPVASSAGPDGWTRIDFAIDPASTQFVSFEGSDFASVFSSVGRVQIGVSIPAALAGVDRVVRFDLDTVGIAAAAPEPASCAALLALLGALALRRAGASLGG